MEKSRKGESQNREDAGAGKRYESREPLFFQCFVAPECQKAGSLKRRVRSQLAKWRVDKFHATVAKQSWK